MTSSCAPVLPLREAQDQVDRAGHVAWQEAPFQHYAAQRRPDPGRIGSRDSAQQSKGSLGICGPAFSLDQHVDERRNGSAGIRSQRCFEQRSRPDRIFGPSGLGELASGSELSGPRQLLEDVEAAPAFIRLRRGGEQTTEENAGDGVADIGRGVRVETLGPDPGLGRVSLYRRAAVQQDRQDVDGLAVTEFGRFAQRGFGLPPADGARVGAMK
jgi:hypothetical protein